MDNIKIIEIKKLRALILKRLYDDSQYELMECILKQSLIGNYTQLEIERQIKYLQSKAYIKIRPSESSDDEEDIIQLTGGGIDIVEGTGEQDPGIGF